MGIVYGQTLGTTFLVLQASMWANTVDVNARVCGTHVHACAYPLGSHKEVFETKERGLSECLVFFRLMIIRRAFFAPLPSLPTALFAHYNNRMGGYVVLPFSEGVQSIFGHGLLPQ